MASRSRHSRLNRTSSSATARDFRMPVRKARFLPQFSASNGAERTAVREHRNAAKTQEKAGICARRSSRISGSRTRRALLTMGFVVAAWHCASFLQSEARAEDAETAFQLIVNPENKLGSESRQVIANMFLKRVVTWSSGETVKPADQRPTSNVRRAFSKSVLKRSVAAVRSYWQQRIFSGRDVPPPELESDAAVVKYVLEHPGAIGYVAPDADIGRARRLTLR